MSERSTRIPSKSGFPRRLGLTKWVVTGCWVLVAYREGMIDESKIAERYRGLGPELNERQRRLWAASEARSCGPGGIAAVVRATGISKNTVQRGMAGFAGGDALGSWAGPSCGGGASALAGV